MSTESPAAVGAQALIGVTLDGRAPNSSLGQPTFRRSVVANPSVALTATASGDPGDMVGQFRYAYYWCRQGLSGLGLFRTALSPWTAAVDADSIVSIALSVIANGGTGVSEKGIVRQWRASSAADWGPSHVCGRIYDNTTTTFTDLAPANSLLYPIDLHETGPTSNETGTNGEAVFLEPDSFDVNADAGVIARKALSGLSGPLRSLPGDFSFPVGFKSTAQPGLLAVLFTFLLGEPTIAREAASPARRLTFAPTSRRRKVRTGSFGAYEGGAGRPIRVYQAVGTELTIDSKMGQDVEIDFKAQGAIFSTSDFGAVETQTGTGELPVLMGVRGDVNRETLDASVLVVSEATNLMVIKARTDAEAYGDETSTVTLDATTHKQTRGSSDHSDRVKLVDSVTGQSLGFDAGSNRRPLLVLFPGDCTLHAADDEFSFAREIPIPDVYDAANPTGPSDDGSYTGAPVVKLRGPCFFTAAHANVSYGDGSTPDVTLDAKGVQIKITAPGLMAHSLGAEANFANFAHTGGEIQLMVTLSRDNVSRLFRRKLEADEQVSFRLHLEGPPIVKQPGVLSAFREEVKLTMSYASIVDSKSPVAGAGLNPETISFLATQPLDSSVQHFGVIVTTGDPIKVPGVTETVLS